MRQMECCSIAQEPLSLSSYSTERSSLRHAALQRSCTSTGVRRSGFRWKPQECESSNELHYKNNSQFEYLAHALRSTLNHCGIVSAGGHCVGECHAALVERAAYDGSDEVWLFSVNSNQFLYVVQ